TSEFRTLLENNGGAGRDDGVAKVAQAAAAGHNPPAVCDGSVQDDIGMDLVLRADPERIVGTPKTKCRIDSIVLQPGPKLEVLPDSELSDQVRAVDDL